MCNNTAEWLTSIRQLGNLDGLVQACNNNLVNTLEQLQSCIKLFIEHLEWIRRLGVWVPLRSRHFLSCVENEWCGPRTVDISNVNFTLKNVYTAIASIQNMGQQMPGPDSLNG